MSNSVRICLVGTGRAGQVHANSIVNYVPEGQLVALVDEVPAALNATSEKYGIQARYESLDKALESSEFDAVVITTPTFTHQYLTVLAAKHGKHVFCEKPMALTFAECDEMIDATTNAGVILQIGFMRRFDPDFSAAWARIAAGEIGRPMLIKSLTHGPGLPPAWARELRTSNGMLAEVNSHDWDTVRWFASSDPQRVYAEIANFKGAANQVITPNFYDNAVVSLRFESGTLGCISGVCPCEYGYDARVEIVGEKGILQIGDLSGQAITVCTSRDQGVIKPVYRTWPERFSTAYVQEMRHFVECVRYSRRPLVDGVDGRWAVACVLAATRSFLEERPVTLREILQAGSVATR